MTQVMTALDFCLLEGHVPSVNPRHQAAFGGVGACARCGRRLDAGIRARDLEQERRWVTEAADMAQYVHDADNAAASMNAYREKRAGDGPWRDLPRDWIRESEEECADLANYLCAALQELGDDRDDEDHAKCQMLLRMALAASVTAFTALGEYRRTDL